MRNGGKKSQNTYRPKRTKADAKSTDFSPKILPNTPLNVIKAAYDNSVYMTKMVGISLWWLITGKVPVTEVSGPVGIVSEINTAVSETGGFEGLFARSVACRTNLDKPRRDEPSSFAGA
ncbi:MAG: hypothetical protein L6V93_18805 [Clostridiales bacterium]|nr:MAG: hypothetical protein L6V93_18805 [Clostridiales bacterium]